jgi:uncharacterized caspase-like protein
MPTTAERPSGRRVALVIATGHYEDPTLAKLRAPGRDASDLAAVLGDAAVGGFEVETVLDAPAESLRRRVARFCTEIGPHDLALVYLSCHGVLDDRGRLYYATADTDRSLLSATALPSAWLNEQLEDCRSRRQILVLDCCHSGAFAKGAKGEGELALHDRFEGRGRIVLTGSRGTEYSFEHDHVIGDSVSSVFTSALVEGLRSGDADRDGDGVVTVGELYDYAYEAVRTKEARQTPTLWTYGAEGDLPVAQSPRGPIVKPVPLPEDLVALLESARPRVREGAVVELAELARSSDAGRALSAREALERVAAADAPSVAAAARSALGATPVEAPQPRQPSAPTSPPAPPPPGPAASAEPPAPAGPRRVSRRLIAIVAGGAALVVAIVIVMSGGEGRPGSEEFHLGGYPGGVAVDDAAWVALQADGEAVRINAASSRERFQTVPHPEKIAAGEGMVWVSYDKGRKLVRIFPEEKPALKIPFGEGCKCSISQLAIGAGRLWVSSRDKPTITAYDVKTGEERKKYGPIAGFEGAFALGENAIWALGFGTDEYGFGGSQLAKIDMASARETVPYHRRDSYFEAVAYGDGRVWIADSANDLVIAYETSSGRDPDAGVEIEDNLSDDRIAFGGDFVLLLDPSKGVLNRIDTDTVERVDPQPIENYPRNGSTNDLRAEFSVGGGFAWVTDPAKGSVHKVDYGGT